MKTSRKTRKMPVFVPVVLGFRDLIWMLIAIVIVLLVSFLSSKASAQNLTVECNSTKQNPELARLPLTQFIP